MTKNPELFGAFLAFGIALFAIALVQNTVGIEAFRLRPHPTT